MRDPSVHENARGGYLILFPSFPGIVAAGASPEEAIRRGRNALAVSRSCGRIEEALPALDSQTGTPPSDDD